MTLALILVWKTLLEIYESMYNFDYQLMMLHQLKYLIILFGLFSQATIGRTPSFQLQFNDLQIFNLQHNQFTQPNLIKFISYFWHNLKDMEKLRSSYKKYQQEVFAQKPRYVAPDKVLKYSKMADDEILKMQTTGQYANYQQAVFYKQKFQNLYEVSNKYEKKKISQENYHKGVREVMDKDFMGNNQMPPMVGSGVNNNNPNNLNRRPISTQNVRPRSKSPLKQFFDDQQAKNTKKVTFSNLLGTNQTPLKFGLKSVHRPGKDIGGSRNNDNSQLRRLEQQNRKLRNQLQSEKSNYPNDDERLKGLRNQVRQLDEQNRKLKSEVSKGSRSQFYLEEQYDPYNLKVRENNIVKINTKNLYQSQKMSQFGGGGVSQDFYKSRKGSQIYFDNQQDLVRSEFTHNPAHLSPTRKSNPILDEDILNASQSTIQTQFLNLQNSELYDEQKNQICRQKIAFFKKSMVLAKGHDFDIAFKRSDFNSQMDKLRLILYVNNKEHKKYNCTIEYDYDRQDFDLNVTRRLKSVQPNNQGRQQIEIHLKNATDLGSLITAKILVGDKMKKIIVPTLFIDFDPDYKYQFQNVGYIQRNVSAPLLIKPMSQFATIDSANNILELHRQYQQKYQIGKLYGKSKACKGMVKLSWKKGNKLKIQTCEEWRTLMGYLFLNAEETIHY